MFGKGGRQIPKIRPLHGFKNHSLASFDGTSWFLKITFQQIFVQKLVCVTKPHLVIANDLGHAGRILLKGIPGFPQIELSGLLQTPLTVRYMLVCVGTLQRGTLALLQMSAARSLSYYELA
jgi:hypothetical protein